MEATYHLHNLAWVLDKIRMIAVPSRVSALLAPQAALEHQCCGCAWPKEEHWSVSASRNWQHWD